MKNRRGLTSTPRDVPSNFSAAVGCVCDRNSVHGFVLCRCFATCPGNYTYGDGDVISTPAGFRRHLVGKTPINVCHCDIAEIRSVGKLVTVQTFLISQRIEFHLK